MDPLVPSSVCIEYLKENYYNFYHNKYYETMSSKLGLNNNKSSQKIIDSLIENMHCCGTHFTNFFRTIEEHSKS